MTAPLANAKSILRSQVRAQLERISAVEKTEASAAICSRLKQQEVWKAAKTLLLYAPLPQEPDIWPLLEEACTAGKIVALPRFFPDLNAYAACQIRSVEADVQPGQFGIREPGAQSPIFPLNRLDLVLVPGVAFDLEGHRLGRGRGHYDRLLAEVRGVTCGVVFDPQVVSEIPVEPHDVRLNCILTPTRWIVCDATTRGL